MPFGDLWIHIIFAHSLFYVIITWTNGTAYGHNDATWILYSKLAHETSRGTHFISTPSEVVRCTYHIWDGACMCSQLLRNIIVCHSNADYAFREMKYNYFRVNFSICPANGCDPGAIVRCFHSLWWRATSIRCSYMKTNFNVQEMISHIAQLNCCQRLLPVCLSSTVDRFNWMPNEGEKNGSKKNESDAFSVKTIRIKSEFLFVFNILASARGHICAKQNAKCYSMQFCTPQEPIQHLNDRTCVFKPSKWILELK